MASPGCGPPASLAGERHAVKNTSIWQLRTSDSAACYSNCGGCACWFQPMRCCTDAMPVSPFSRGITTEAATPLRSCAAAAASSPRPPWQKRPFKQAESAPLQNRQTEQHGTQCCRCPAHAPLAWYHAAAVLTMLSQQPSGPQTQTAPRAQLSWQAQLPQTSQAVVVADI